MISVAFIGPILVSVTSICLKITEKVETFHKLDVKCCFIF